MKIEYKQALILSVTLFVVGIFFVILYSSSALNSMCSDFELTAQVTQPNNLNECSGIFNDMFFNSTIWLALWAVLCFFIFLIVIEHFLPKKKRKIKRKKGKKRK